MISDGHTNLHSTVFRGRTCIGFVDADNIKRGFERSLANSEVPIDLREVFSVLQLLLLAQLSRYFVYSAVKLDGNAPDWLIEMRSQPQFIFRSTLLKETKTGHKQEGVDVILAVEAMQNASRRSMEVCVVFSGDGDLLPLIDALVAEGVFVVVVSFDNPEKSDVASRLRDASDDYIHIGRSLLRQSISSNDRLINSDLAPIEVMRDLDGFEEIETEEAKVYVREEVDGKATAIVSMRPGGRRRVTFGTLQGLRAYAALTKGREWA
ncbi:MAG: NYN domain-containing protein [Pseudomonadota bacterium]